jgi:hypothetical protein
VIRFDFVVVETIDFPEDEMVDYNPLSMGASFVQPVPQAGVNSGMIPPAGSRPGVAATVSASAQDDDMDMDMDIDEEIAPPPPRQGAAPHRFESDFDEPDSEIKVQTVPRPLCH